MKIFFGAMLSVCLLSGVVHAQDSQPPAQPLPVVTKDAPAAAGPYSQAIKANGFVFVAGQIPRDPVTNKLVEGDVAVQADRVLKNIAAILAASGSGMDRVVRTTVYLKNMADFAKMNEVYATHFKTNPPARTTIGVADLPGGAQIEIDVVAVY